MVKENHFGCDDNNGKEQSKWERNEMLRKSLKQIVCSG